MTELWEDQDRSESTFGETVDRGWEVLMDGMSSVFVVVCAVVVAPFTLLLWIIGRLSR